MSLNDPNQHRENKVIFTRKDFPDSIDPDKFDKILDKGLITGGGLKGRKGEDRAWMIDCRRAFASTENLQTISDYFVDILDKSNINQVVVKGYGGYLLAGSTIINSYTPITGGIIREERKKHDMKNIIEGDLNPSQPILLMDDILNSGKSIVSAIKVLKENGWKPKDIHCGVAITFLWGMGVLKISQQGVQNIHQGVGLKIS